MDGAGVTMTAAATHELDDIVTELANPGVFLAFSSGDPGVNNYLVDGDADGRLIDFEAAGFRHALSDLINDLYVPGPMWLTAGDPMRNGIEEAYRSMLAPVVPEVTDDRHFGPTLGGAPIGTGKPFTGRRGTGDRTPRPQDTRNADRLPLGVHPT